MDEIDEKITKLRNSQFQNLSDDMSGSHYSQVGSYRGGGGLNGSDYYHAQNGRNSNSRGNQNGQNAAGDGVGKDGKKTDYEYRERRKHKYGDSYLNVIDPNNFEAQGSIDIQLVMQHAKQHPKESKMEATEESTQEATKETSTTSEIEVIPIKNQMSLCCYIPPKAGRNGFASFSGKTGFFHQRGYADTTLSLGYHLFRGNAFLCDWHTLDGTSKVRQIAHRCSSDFIYHTHQLLNNQILTNHICSYKKQLDVLWFLSFIILQSIYIHGSKGTLSIKAAATTTTTTTNY